MADDGRLTGRRFQDAGGVDDWRVLDVGATAWFDAPSHVAGAELVRRIAGMAGGGRVPEADVRARGVRVRIPRPPDLTGADVELARAVSAAARDLGLTADPSALQEVQVAIDVLDKGAVVPFWQAALGYERVGQDDLVDPLRRDPAIWFQEQQEPRPLRNRIHLDVVNPDPGVRAAVRAAGGRYIRGAFDVQHADAEGNEVDLIPAGPVEALGPDTDWHGPFAGMTFYPTDSPARAAELVAAVAALADGSGMPLLVDLRPAGVMIDTGKDQEEDNRFGDLARQIQEAACGQGLTADASRLRFVQLGIDAVDVPAARAFWRAVLGYEYDPRSEFGVTDIYDPRRLNPPVFFQTMDGAEEERRAQRNRIHVDLFVPDDQARARIDAALGAGGRIVYDEQAPAWWTLADPEGNEVDIAVTVGREET